MSIPPPPLAYDEYLAACASGLYARICRDCPDETRNECRRRFKGALWWDKSHGGVGCAHPIDEHTPQSQSTDLSTDSLQERTRSN